MKLLYSLHSHLSQRELLTLEATLEVQHSCIFPFVVLTVKCFLSFDAVCPHAVLPQGSLERVRAARIEVQVQAKVCTDTLPCETYLL